MIRENSQAQLWFKVKNREAARNQVSSLLPPSLSILLSLLCFPMYIHLFSLRRLAFFVSPCTESDDDTTRI